MGGGAEGKDGPAPWIGGGGPPLTCRSCLYMGGWGCEGGMGGGMGDRSFPLSPKGGLNLGWFCP